MKIRGEKIKPYGNSNPLKHSIENYLKIHGIYRNSIVEFKVNGKPCKARICGFKGEEFIAIGVDNPREYFCININDFEDYFLGE